MRKGILTLCVPVIGVVLLIGALVARPSGPRSSRRSSADSSPRPRPVSQPYVAATRPAPLPKPADPRIVGHAAEGVRVRSTYENYRTAVATDNQPLQSKLLPVLRRDGAALAWAEEELAQATEDFDRDVARRMVNALRN